LYPPTTPFTIKSILPLNSFFTLLKIFRGSWPEIFALVEISAELEYWHNFLQIMCEVTLIATFEESPFISGEIFESDGTIQVVGFFSLLTLLQKSS